MPRFLAFIFEFFFKKYDQWILKFVIYLKKKKPSYLMDTIDF